jgi:hypothetical protein
LLVADDERDDRADTTVGEVMSEFTILFGLYGNSTDLDPTVGDEAAVDALVAVVGLRRGSCRRFETPASRLKDELGLPFFELLEKLCLVELARENMLALACCNCHVQCRGFW